MSPEMQTLYRHCVSDPQLNVMFRKKAAENAANVIDHLFSNGEQIIQAPNEQQIAALPKPKSFSEIRETLLTVMRGGRGTVVAELGKLSVFSKIKKSARCKYIRQNLYRMERNGQVERVGMQDRNIVWRLSMTREQLFEYLMEHDESFRKEIANSAVDTGMELYQAGLTMLGDKENRMKAVASATSKVEKKSAKNHHPRDLEGNEQLRKAIMRLVDKHGPISSSDIRAKMSPKAAVLIEGQRLHNQLSRLKQNGRIRWSKGTKRPNVTWESVSKE